MGNFDLKREGRNVDATIENGKVKRKVNAMGLAESMGRKSDAFRKNVGGTNASGKKSIEGMENLRKK